MATSHMPGTIILSVEDRVVSKTHKVFSLRRLYSGRSMVGIWSGSIIYTYMEKAEK